MVKCNVAFLKGNAIFEIIHKWQLVLEKTLKQGVSKIYLQILGNACETFLIFFACASKAMRGSHVQCVPVDIPVWTTCMKR